MRLLLVEDAALLRASVATALRRVGHAVDEAEDAATAAHLLRTHAYDCAVLDLMLPDGDGLDLLDLLRSGKLSTPVLLMTARDAIVDRVGGLRRGADDYLTKPFAMDELLARVDALLRRAHGQAAPLLRVGRLAIDTAQRIATVDDAPLTLNRREYVVLELLARRVGEVVDREQILDRLYDHERSTTSNVVESAVYVLRLRLRERGVGDLLVTRRGLGYQLGGGP